MSDVVDADAVGLLPVRSIFLQAVAAPFVYFSELLQVGYPFLIMHFFGLDLYSFHPAWILSLDGFFMMAGRVVLYVVLLLAATVGCHRIFVIGRQSVEGMWFVWFGLSAWRYLGWALLLALLTLLFNIIFFFAVLPLWDASVNWTPSIWSPQNFSARYWLLEAATWLGLAAVTYLVVRLSLLLPACATNYRKTLSLAWAWDMARRNQWRLYLLLGVLPLVTSALLSSLSWSEFPVFNLLSEILWLYIAVVELAILSFSFQFIVGSVASAGGPVTEQSDQAQ